MIDPRNITDFGRTNDQLLELFVFAMLAAGHASERMAPLLQRLLDDLPGDTVFEKLDRAERLGILEDVLRHHRAGYYRTLVPGIAMTLGHLRDNPNWLRTASPDEFVAVPGVGAKTSRLLVVYSRPDQHYAVLDRHTLAWLTYLGFEGVPKESPQSLGAYRHWEGVFLAMCGPTGCSPRILDTNVWQQRQQLDGVIFSRRRSTILATSLEAPTRPGVLTKPLLAWLAQLGLPAVPKTPPRSPVAYSRWAEVVLEICRMTGCEAETLTKNRFFRTFRAARPPTKTGKWLRRLRK